MEIDRALNPVFGRPSQPREVSIFAAGVAHAFERPASEFRFHPPEGVVLPDEVQRYLDGYLEFLALAGPEEDHAVSGIDVTSHRRGSYDFQESQERVTRIIHETFGSNKEGRHRAIAAREFADLLNPLHEALRMAGIPYDEFRAFAASEGPEGLTRFLTSIPTRDVGYSFRRFRHDNPDTVHEPGDLNDIGALGVATVYCDVVITERQWAHHLNQSGIADKYQTQVTSNLLDLAGMLATT